MSILSLATDVEECKLGGAAATSSTHPLLMLVSLVIGIANLAFSKFEVA